MAETKAKSELTEMEAVELEFKKMQIELFKEQMAERNEQKARLQHNRERQNADYRKGQAELARRQAVCKHRKGGRDNKFARGTDANYSIITNTYPDGLIVIMCTRCGKEVEKPSKALKKSDPKRYAEMWAEWQKWNEFPTDNSPSGGKIFEIEHAA